MKLWPSTRKKQAASPVAEAKAASYLLGMGALRVMQQNYEAFASEGYALNPVVRACVEMIAKPAASVQIKAYTKDKTGKLIESKNHPILQLIQRPNVMTSGEDFVGNFIRYYLISGNAYIKGDLTSLVGQKKKPSELWLLKPSAVKVVTSDTPVPKGYEHRTNNGAEFYPFDPLSGRCDILHKKTFNPVDENTGLAPMVAAAFGIDLTNEGNKWNLRLLQNEGRPSGALMVKGGDNKPLNLTDEQYQRLKEEIQQQYSGSNNAGKPMLLEGGLEWKEMSVNAKDMDHKENINNSKRDIALAFGVPPMLLGIPGDNTYSNMAEAKLALWNESILPILGSLLSSLNNWLAPLYGDGVELWYDENTITALEPLRKMLADRVEASTTLTINEKRRIMGNEDTAGGDVLLVDSSKIPLELIGDQGLTEPGSNANQTAS